MNNKIYDIVPTIIVSFVFYGISGLLKMQTDFLTCLILGMLTIVFIKVGEIYEHLGLNNEKEKFIMLKITKDRNGELLWCGPTQVIDSTCIYLQCFNAHDCGYYSNDKWVRRGYCLTNWKNGCPAKRIVRPCCKTPLFNWNTKAKHSKRCCNCGAKSSISLARQFENDMESKGVP